MSIYSTLEQPLFTLRAAASPKGHYKSILYYPEIILCEMSNYETSNETASQRELNIHFIFVWNTIYPEMEASADKQVAGSNRPLANAQKNTH